MIAIEKIITSLEENICLLVKPGKITDVALIYTLEKEMQPTPGTESLVGCCLWGRTESDTTEAT